VTRRMFGAQIDMNRFSCFGTGTSLQKHVHRVYKIFKLKSYRRGHEDLDGEYPFFNLDSRWDFMVKATRCPIYRQKKHSVPTAQEAGWTPGSVLTRVKNLARTGISSPACPGLTH
jgi:hypothetical protein